MKKLYSLFAVGIENLKNLKYHTFQKRHWFFLLFAGNENNKMKMKMKMTKYSKKNNDIKDSQFH